MSAFLGEQGAAEGRRKGGSVKPKGKHRVHMIIVIGLRSKADQLGKRGLISEKAAARRKL
jgi:hypothetical protein